MGSYARVLRTSKVSSMSPAPSLFSEMPCSQVCMTKHLLATLFRIHRCDKAKGLLWRSHLVRGATRYRPPGAADREFGLYFVRFLAPKVVRMGPDNPQDSFGPSFRPNGRFWTRFKSFSMIWARTDIVDPTWTSRTRPGRAPWSGLDPSQRLRNGPGMLLGGSHAW